MSEQNEVTQEQMQRAILETQAERESYKFMRKHIADFSPCQANAAILTAYIQQHGLEWNQENLETAYEASKGQLVASDVPKLAPITTEPAANELPPAPAGAIWPTTKAEIQAMPQALYRAQYHNKQTGTAFRARINAVLQRGI